MSTDSDTSFEDREEQQPKKTSVKEDKSGKVCLFVLAS